MSSIPLEIRKSFGCSEYAVRNIFVDCLMNSRLRITKGNIGQIEGSVKTSLEYFEGWFSEQPVLRRRYEERNSATALTARNWKRHFRADQTYNNIRIGVAGFFHYARTLLSLENGPEYIPPLHSNQGSLEALFSRVRAWGRDTVDKYASAVSAQNTVHSVRSQSVYSYPKCDIALEQDEIQDDIRKIGMNKSVRTKQFEEWTPSRDMDSSTKSQNMCSVCPQQ